MVFSNSTTEDGIVQEINRMCGSTDNNFTLKAKTARVNQALDRFFTIAFMNDKNWHFDDYNQTDLPIATADLVSGQQDYKFASELLKVKGVFVKDSDGVFHELTEQDEPQNTFLLPSGNSGIPTKYKIIANSILLDYIPNYNSTGGLKVEFSRNASKFISTDTTKEPGIPSLFHPWLCWAASLPYLVENKLPAKNDVAMLVQQGEDAIARFIGSRHQIRKPRVTPNIENTR